MHSRDVRRTFLEFFEQRGHQVVPSSPLVLPRDPTLLFANAGMNQFKEVFRGHESRPYRRAASSQKCLRVSGKHNDLEEVGRTPRHHTFFEMLGNFSFGDYFKKDAIRWGWELVTDVYGIDPGRLFVTVFVGDEEFPGDDEAARIWEREVGVPASRVIALGRKDNFWQMGDTGPAGPCSEIHVDVRPAGPAGATPLSDPERFLEIWNLVFMQYDLQPDGSAKPLPAPSVDTGAGLERLTSVLQGASSNYDTDLFRPIIDRLAAEAGVAYGGDTARDDSLRVISDHLRAITMLVAEGIIPGPEKRGAVLRRILRRALRHGRLLNLPVPFLHRHIASVVDVLSEPFPELREAQGVVERVVRREEERFDRTLAEGFERLEERISELIAKGQNVLPGEEAFQLESERGLPMDLLRDALDERRIALDEVGYAAARERHVETSRVLRPGAAAEAPTDIAVLGPWRGQGSRFVGRETLRVEAARVLATLADGQPVPRIAAGQRGEVILDETPFYAEAGGQVGDRGLLVGGSVRAHVEDTHTPIPGVTLHRVHVEQGALEPGTIVVAEVDAARRRSVMRHHTATHLLHAALRRTLGTHVRQAGSLVAPERLRFDFAHYEPVDREALRDIESEVNEAILADLPVETEELPLEEALARGALAFFGDRYGERVRVLRIGDISMELCGGTHVARTGEIGTAVVTGERGVAAGVRRIEASAGTAALERARQDIDALEALAAQLGVPRGAVAEDVVRRLEAVRRLQKENDELRARLARADSASAARTSDIGGIQVIAQQVEGMGRGQRRDLADTLRQKNPDAVVILGAAEDGKVSLLVATGSRAAARVDAREVIRRLTPLVGGAGGGGRADMAEAGGRDPQALGPALDRAADIVREVIAP
ncbi:MAG: alanine--tRNA ligase [Acidobacteria bacterium]|nr:alanine--tRNA ligase [Acidobacteriota bacterium]